MTTLNEHLADLEKQNDRASVNVSGKAISFPINQVIGMLLEIKHELDEMESSSDVRYKENDRLQKIIDETQSGCEVLSRTVQDQSDTLNNREKVVQEAEHARDEALQRIDDLTVHYEEMKDKAFEAIQKGGDITPVEFAGALDLYSLAVARISSTDAHPQIVVALVQMAMHMRQLENMGDVLKWLRGSQ